MNFYLPTREECQEIVKNNETFYCTSRNVDGFDVELYDYRLASYTDYLDNNAWELRGLCFVNNNGVWERNILMNKFFNLNETGPSIKTFLIELENGEIIEVTEFDKIKLTNNEYKTVNDLKIDDDIFI